jgi:hypothetical protein
MATAAILTPVAPPSAPTFGTTPAAQPPPGQPDIAYHPDWEKYQARVARRTQTETLTKDLPEGFPKELKGDLVWEGETIAQEYNWTYTFSAEQLEDVDKALAHFKCEFSFSYFFESTLTFQPSTLQRVTSHKKHSLFPRLTMSCAVSLVNCTTVMASLSSVV